MHTLYSTPTLQDITTVKNDLKRPLAHFIFEDFLDHVTDHINNYESLRSFNQQVSNITKNQTFKEPIKRWPQFNTLIATWEIDNNNVLTRPFAHFTDYFPNQYGNLHTDVKPRGSNACNVRQSGRGRGKGKGDKGKGKNDKGKGKSDKGKGRGLGRFVYWDVNDIPAHKRQHTEHQVSNNRTTLLPSIPAHLHDRVLQPPTKYAVATPLRRLPISSTANPDPKLYYYCNYHHGWNLSHSGPECRVMSVPTPQRTICVF